METEVLIAFISLIGTMIGAFCGVVAASRMTDFRLKQLEKKVDAHNRVVERTYQLEGQLAEVAHEIQDLKRFHAPE